MSIPIYSVALVNNSQYGFDPQPKSNTDPDIDGAILEIALCNDERSI
jgi:hypothetical protein